jgi:hypothetical protein
MHIGLISEKHKVISVQWRRKGALGARAPIFQKCPFSGSKVPFTSQTTCPLPHALFPGAKCPLPLPNVVYSFRLHFLPNGLAIYDWICFCIVFVFKNSVIFG